jgi:hypothetical protein
VLLEAQFYQFFLEGREGLPYAICRIYGLMYSLSGSPAVISGRAVVTDAPVSVVNKISLALIQPSPVIALLC